MTDAASPERDGGSENARTLVFRGGAFQVAARNVPEEVAIAVSVGGSTHAVMMATPLDLQEMALGLVLNERIAAGPSEIERVDVVRTESGIDCQVRLVPQRAASYVARRRQMTGPVGCGLCGVESLELAAPDLPVLSPSDRTISPKRLTGAVAAMAKRQVLSRATRAVHAAAFHRFDAGADDRSGNGPEPVVVREDVGRHNALDKVAGHLAMHGIDPADGFLTITSRVSVELIQKAAVMGCGLIAAVSAPTALAIAEAERSGISLVAVVRGDEFEIFTHAGRIAGAADAAADHPHDTLAGEGEIHAA